MLKHEFESLYGHKIGLPRWEQIETAYMSTNETKQEFVARMQEENGEKLRARKEKNPPFPRREARRLLLNQLAEEDEIFVAWRGRDQDYPQVSDSAVAIFQGRDTKSITAMFNTNCDIDDALNYLDDLWSAPNFYVAICDYSRGFVYERNNDCYPVVQ